MDKVPFVKVLSSLQMIEDKLTPEVMAQIRELVTAGDAVKSQRWLRHTFFK